MSTFQPEMPIEIEAETLEQVEKALAAGVQTILVDNMDVGGIREHLDRTVGRGDLELYVLAQRATQQRFHLLDHAVEIDDTHLGVIALREGEELAYECGAVHHRPLDLDGVLTRAAFGYVVAQ